MTFDNVPNSVSPRLHLGEQTFLTMDVHSPEIRSFNVPKIKEQNSYPKMMHRRWFWANGYRYRLHRNNRPSKSDMVLPSYETVILVHGCYWRRYGCWMTSTPATRRDSWQMKSQDNVSRDRRSTRALTEAGCLVMTVRECTLRCRTADPKKVEDQITKSLMSDESYGESGT